jgi:hypothetical protein
MNTRIYPEEVYDKIIRDFAMKIAANMIGPDIIPITPMDGPVVELVYPRLDYSEVKLSMLMDESRHLIKKILNKHCS